MIAPSGISVSPQYSCTLARPLSVEIRVDPNLFHLDWERTFEALVAIIVLAFFVERSCALLFESRWYIRLFEDPRVGRPKTPPVEHLPVADPPADGTVPAEKLAPVQPDGSTMPGRLYPIKELVAFGLAAVVCVFWHFDAVSMILLRERTSFVGSLITAAVIAGGSKASITLFHSLMNVRSNAEQERQRFKRGDTP